MIEGGWDFVYPAYAVTIGGFSVLAAVVIVRLRYWSKKAKELKR